MMNLAIHSRPKAAMFVAATISVCTAWWYCLMLLPTKCTAIVDTNRPRKARPQNGMTSLNRCERPRLPHTHARFR